MKQAKFLIIIIGLVFCLNTLKAKGISMDALSSVKAHKFAIEEKPKEEKPQKPILKEPKPIPLPSTPAKPEVPPKKDPIPPKKPKKNELN